MYMTKSEAKMVTNHKDNIGQLFSSGEITFLSEVTLSKIEDFSQHYFNINDS